MTRYLVTEIRSLKFCTEAELENGMAPTEEALQEAAFDVILEEIGVGSKHVKIDYLTLDFHEHELIRSNYEQDLSTELADPGR